MQSSAAGLGIGAGATVIALVITLWLIGRRTRPGVIRAYFAVVFLPALGGIIGRAVIRSQSIRAFESGVLDSAELHTASAMAMRVVALGLGASALMAVAGALLFFQPLTGRVPTPSE